MKQIPHDDDHFDPIVEIIRLAYRRGLALRREREEKKKTADSDNLSGETPSAEQDPKPEGKEPKHE